MQAQPSLEGSTKHCTILHDALFSGPSQHQVLQGTSATASAVPLPGVRILTALWVVGPVSDVTAWAAKQTNCVCLALEQGMSRLCDGAHAGEWGRPAR